MTEENYNYRTSQTLLRNQFPGEGKLQIPIIPKFQEQPGDFDNLLLIGFDKTHLEDQNHLDRMVHFFLYDYRFERVWKNPDNDIEKLSRYRAVLSPDFSMYLEMAPVMQLYNVFRNRWCGAYWASKGLRVVPIVMMAEIFMGIYFNLSFWYKLIAKTWWGAILSTIGCIVLLAVNFAFVPRYGYIACAWGGFCGYGVCMLLSYFIGQHYNPIHYPVKAILFYFALTLALFAAMNTTRSLNTALSLTINTLLIFVYIAVVMLNERELVTKVLKKIKQK